MTATQRRDQADRARQALTRNLGPLLEASIPRPHTGWLHATREALGMSRVQMGARMGVTRRRIAQLEQAEKAEAIKLDTLRRAAAALECDLVYAFVPRQSYDSVIDRQAEAKSQPLLDRIAHTMGLENQEPDTDAIERARQEQMRELVESGHLWDL